MSVFCTAYIIKMAALSVGSIYLVLMMCSRAYLGAHTWNQVLFGATLGVCLAVVAHHIIKPRFYGMWERSRSECRYLVNFRELIGMGFLVVPFVLFSFIVFLVRLDHVPDFMQDPHDLKAWQARMAKAGCSDLQISKFPNSATIDDFKSLRTFIFPVVGLLSQFAEWHFFVNRNKINSSVWIWHKT